ncbi:MAG: hypothetical protein L6R39_003597 [Caloplaca ligustica]|nr:MAG: hypothetical protein L6R39_003597 [Caloplaca ligustica]
MPSFRDCCRHPRASSPGLPNVYIVPSPTQDDGYDTDAVRIATPDDISIERLQPSPDEPRPSVDTIVHRGSPQRSSIKLEDDNDQAGAQSLSKSLRVKRVNSIVIPRRRSHTQSQPLPSPSTAALDNYIKLTPSRAALRKRLEAVQIIDEPELPPSPKLEPVRVTSIPESALSRRWRLSYNESHPIFRPSGLRERSANEQRGEASGEDKPGYTSHKASAESTEEQRENAVPGATIAALEVETYPDDEAPINITEMVTKRSRKRGLVISGHYSMPGSYQSDSTAASIHLYDMRISQRVASSNSNIVASSDVNVRRQRSSTTGTHAMALMNSSRYQRSRESSSLQSPKESSSVYSSQEEELASSRRSSMLLIQGLPERLERLKSRATAGDLYRTSAQQSQITVIPRSRFPTNLTDEEKQLEANRSRIHGNGAGNDERNLYEEKTGSPPLRRSSTEPRLNKFKRDGCASFDGSGEWHLSPHSRQPTGLLQPQSTGLVSRQSTSLLARQDAASVWERALREHAQEDNAIFRARVGSISYEIGRDDLKRRARSRRFTRTPSPLQEITEAPWSQARGMVEEPASGRVSPTQSLSGRISPSMRISPCRASAGQLTAAQASTSTQSVDSWTRYPSHTFRSRAETANANDNVIARDFAIGQPFPQRKISKKKSRSMTFGRKFLHKVGRLYKTRSSDFRRYHAGHRSSISVGGVLEYPELEIPRPSFEPVLLAEPRDEVEMEREIEPEEALREAIATPIPSSPQRLPVDSQSTAETSGPDLNALRWEGGYDDCVVRPRNTSTEDEGIAPDDMGPVSSTTHESLRLDEEQQAEVDRVRDEALKAADECVRRSMDMVRDRFPKRL